MSDGLKLLGAIIDTGSVTILRELDSSLFIEEEVALYDFMRSHYRRYGNIPAIETIETEIDVKVPEAEEVPEYYIKRVRDRQLYGEVRTKFNALKDSLRRYDMDEAREVISELKAATRTKHSATDVRDLREALGGVMALYQDAHDNPGLAGVPSGWPRYDYNTGGYQPGDLVSFVARPAMGKTFLLLVQALAAWSAGYSVLIVSMEMTIEQCARRMLALETGINPIYLRKGQLSKYAMVRVSHYLSQIIGSKRLRIFAGGMKSKVSDVDILISEFRPDILYVDGVYLMHPDTKRSMGKLDRIPEVFDELKGMTLAQNIPVVVTSQFSRQAGKKGKEGSLENIAYTDAISTHSSLVISITDAAAPYEKTRKVLEFMKGREGETGKYDINYGFKPIDMSEVPLLTDEAGNIIPEARIPTVDQTNWMT